MTFEEIVDEITARLNITSSDSEARIGRAVNRLYKRITTTTGMNTTRQVVGASQNVTIGNPVVVFSSMEKVTRVYDDVGTFRELQELPFLQLREQKSIDSDTPKFWAHQTGTGTSVSIRLDATPLTAYNLKADGYSTVSTLSGSDVPVIPESFHDVLIAGVLVDEFQKMEKYSWSKEVKAEFEQRMSELRYHLATSAYQDRYAGAIPTSSRLGAGGSGGSSDNGVYVRLFGRSGGQEVHGGTDAGDDLILASTTHATKGLIIVEDAVDLLSGQIAFPATQAASSDPNTLDDYEEDDWTPTITGSTSASGQAYSTQLGRYIKIGKQVTAWGRITLSTLGTITGSVRIGGLPFTSATNGLLIYSGSISYFSNMSTEFTFLGIYVHPTSTQAELTQLPWSTGETGVGGLVQADLSATTDIAFVVMYEAVS